jgi:hypothetical protein
VGALLAQARRSSTRSIRFLLPLPGKAHAALRKLPGYPPLDRKRRTWKR